MRLDKELFWYVVFGTLTTIVNIVVYFALEYIGVNYIISNIIAWFLSVLFAYVTNRIWVFESKSPDILRRWFSFSAEGYFQECSIPHCFTYLSTS